MEEQDTAIEPEAQDLEVVDEEITDTDEAIDESAGEDTATQELEQPAQPEQAVEEPQEEDDDFDLEAINQTPKVAPVDISNFINPETQELDAVAYNQAIQEQMSASVQAAVQQATTMSSMQTKYEKQWDKAYEKYPELKGNREYKDMVQAIHANSALPGSKYLSPAKAAEKLFGIRSEAKAEGMKTAQTTRRVQAAANLGNPTPPVEAVNNKSDSLKGKMLTGSAVERKQATTDYIAELMRTGRF